MISKIPDETWAVNNHNIEKGLPKEGVANGQSAINVDTGDLIIFDKEDNEWKTQ